MFIVNHVSEINTPDLINMVIDYLNSRIISLWSFAINFINKNINFMLLDHLMLKTDTP